MNKKLFKVTTKLEYQIDYIFEANSIDDIETSTYNDQFFNYNEFEQICLKEYIIKAVPITFQELETLNKEIDFPHIYLNDIINKVNK